jgi:hypothetical protein
MIVYMVATEIDQTCHQSGISTLVGIVGFNELIENNTLMNHSNKYCTILYTYALHCTAAAAATHARVRS